MKKRDKIIYWVATLWLALGMLANGIGQLLKIQSGAGSVDVINHLGYPLYLLGILGSCKLLGTLIILAPGIKLLKEWAYAGFVFMMLGAIISHVMVGDGIDDIWPALLLLMLTLISWYFRPENRRLIKII